MRTFSRHGIVFYLAAVHTTEMMVANRKVVQMKSIHTGERHRTSSTEPLLVDVATAAQMLAISQRKLWSLTNIGDVPCVRIGKSVRYSLEELRAWTRSKMIQSAVQE
jgi:predicted DNA-binding transcriptional regulator AlpA